MGSQSLGVENRISEDSAVSFAQDFDTRPEIVKASFILVQAATTALHDVAEERFYELESNLQAIETAVRVIRSEAKILEANLAEAQGK